MPALPFYLGTDELTPEILVSLGAQPAPPVEASPESRSRLATYRGFIETALAGEATIYGVNTGFGFLADVRIPKQDLAALQVNLIRSHACGVGLEVAAPLVRSLLVLRAHSFLRGHSGVTWNCVATILSFLRHDILPMIPEQGSVGASGDLAPLAHLAMGLIGEGDVRQGERLLPAAQVLPQLGIKPLAPLAKEGLALINGTQFMTTLGSYAVVEAKRLALSADIIAALSLSGFRGTTTAYDPRIYEVRPHWGQGQVTGNLGRLLGGVDEIRASHTGCGKVQDPYSFRCVPQVHGASRDTIAFVANTLKTELNSVTDNPLLFPDGSVLSGGNFHGQPIAMGMDFLGIAVAELGSISERRIEKLTNPHMSGLPAFVTRDSGLNSGFMIPHVVAASLVSENKILAHPASVDSIPTSADKEDHVSMGPIAARKARAINLNVARVLAIELLTACQAIDLLAPLKPTPPLQGVYNRTRALSPYQPRDASLHKDIELLARAILAGDVVAWAEHEGVNLQ